MDHRTAQNHIGHEAVTIRKTTALPTVAGHRSAAGQGTVTGKIKDLQTAENFHRHRSNPSVCPRGHLPPTFILLLHPPPSSILHLPSLQSSQCYKMPSFKIKVKWGKEVFQDVEVNTDEEPMVFKAQLMALTGVQVLYT